VSYFRPFAAALALAALLASSACTPEEPAPPPPLPPPLQSWSNALVSDLRMQWTAAPGIDLLGGPAVPLRAYMESRKLAFTTGDLDNLYPGFRRAVQRNRPDSPSSSEWGIWPDENIPAKSPIVGNIGQHILSITTADRDVSAVVCSYGYTSAKDDGHGQFVTAGPVRNFDPAHTGISTHLVKMRAPEAPSPTLPPQRGPLPAPVDDVFGTWTITGILDDYSAVDEPSWDRQWPTFRADVAGCDNGAPDSQERRDFLVRGSHPRSDFPTKPAYPGWPGGGT
jgi:hypothetical protein